MQFHIQLAISSVWKVRFQQFKHFSVACNDLFHMVHLIHKWFFTQIWPFFPFGPWINIQEMAYFE